MFNDLLVITVVATSTTHFGRPVTSVGKVWSLD